MKYYSYVIKRDFGFAPNPFNGMCTLATCKPPIRERANIGDWVFGTGSVSLKCQHHLIYAMKITEKITFNEYWFNEKYRCKKPVMNGSLKVMYGDNIYHQNDNGEWLQADSHHSYENGEQNPLNVKTDTSTTDSVLISDEFYYFGVNKFLIPDELALKICKTGPGYRHADPEASKILIEFLKKNYEAGYLGDPIQFNEFDRYDGK